MPPLAEQIVQQLQQAGYQAHYVGGAVRDRLLRRPVQDIDVATNASPKTLARLFRHTKATGKNFKVTMVLRGDETVEVATWRQDIGLGDGRHPSRVAPATLIQDAQRRDFTINAIYYDPRTKRYQDPVNGRDDLRHKIIRFVGDPEYRLQEDHLRLLRAVRFKNEIDGTYAPTTWSALKKYAPLVNKLPFERIRTEIEKMILGRHPDHAWQDLITTGLLSALGLSTPPRFPTIRHRLTDITVGWSLLARRLPAARRALFLEWLTTLGYGAKTRSQIRTIVDYLQKSSAPRTPSRDWDLFRHPYWSLIKEALRSLDPRLARRLQRRYQQVQGYQHWTEWINGQDLWLAGWRGPNIATWLQKARSAQLNGQFKNRAQALRWIKERAPVRRP